MTASITVGNGVGYMNIGAVGSALMILPSGSMSLIGRNVPSFAISSVAIRYLKATRAMVWPPP